MGLRVEGLGCRMQGAGCKDSTAWGEDAMLGARHTTSDAEMYHSENS